MKRTLLLTHEYYPFHGGVANYCYGLFSHLPEQNYVVATDMAVVSSKFKVESNSPAPLTTINLQLSYRLKNLTEAFYFVWNIQLDGTHLAQFKNKLNLEERIVRYLIIKQD
jgi:ribosomal protein S6